MSQKRFNFELPDWSYLWKETKELLAVIFIALGIRLFIYEPYYVPSESMMNSLLIGDYVFCTKFDYGYSNHSIWGAPNLFEGRIFNKMPERGDVTVFHLPHLEDKLYVKRVVGLPGDKIQVQKGILYINDVEAPRKYVGTYVSGGKTYNQYIETLPNKKEYYVLDLYDNTMGPEAGDYDNTPPYYVPEGHYFMMGDNRDESGDSRVNMGPIHEKFLVAKVRRIAYSFSEKLFPGNLSWSEQLSHFVTFFKSLRMERLFMKIDYLKEIE